MSMWSGTCQATKTKGGKCTRKATWRLWVFHWQAERYDYPTWVESCGHHITEARNIVSMVEALIRQEK